MKKNILKTIIGIALVTTSMTYASSIEAEENKKLNLSTTSLYEYCRTSKRS